MTAPFRSPSYEGVLGDLHNRIRILEAVAAAAGCGDVVLTSPYATAVLADTPLTYWQCQDCPTFPRIEDSSGNDIWSFGRFWESYTFNGWRTSPGALTSAGDVFFHPTSGAGGLWIASAFPISTVTDNFSIEFWAYLTEGEPMAFFNNGGPMDGWIANFNGEFTGVGPELIGGNYPGGFLSDKLPWNNWYHIAVVRDSTLGGSGGVLGYVNGVATGFEIDEAPPSIGPFSSTFWGGQVSHMAFYEYALSAGQIATHYAAR